MLSIVSLLVKTVELSVCVQRSMEVVVNHLHQVCLSGTGQWHNSLILSTARPESIVFNNITYPCRWDQTTHQDGQWKEIILSFCRRQSRGSWPTEHYVRVGKDLYILQYRCPSDSQRHQESADGILYDVPLKLLRCLSCSRGISSQVPPTSHGLYDLGWASVQHSVDLI